MPTLTLSELWGRIDPLIDQIDLAQSREDLQTAATAARGEAEGLQRNYFLFEALVANDLIEKAEKSGQERIKCNDPQ